jgi:lipoprotein-anchoring transpeptidase ErfK/SrfK
LPVWGGGPAQRPPGDMSDAPGNAPAPADQTGSILSTPMPPPGVAPAPSAATSQSSDAVMLAALPPEDQPEQGPRKQLPPQFQRQIVSFSTTEPAGTIIIDTPHTYLYLVLGDGKALRYGIGVGREGFTWSGTERISRMKEWPDWYPPKEMIQRQPYLPRFMAGGDTNPLGARAMYLGNTEYRIHGTNQPSTIGTFVSSGCIRLTNEDVEDLYSRVSVGTHVVVLPGPAPNTAAAAQPVAR